MVTGQEALYHEREREKYFSHPRGQEGGVLSDRKEAADQEIEDILAGCQERLLNTALHCQHLTQTEPVQ